MDIKQELREAIKDSVLGIWAGNWLKVGVKSEADKQQIDIRINNLITALLPIIAKYAPSLCEVDEGKIRKIPLLSSQLEVHDNKPTYRTNYSLQYLTIESINAIAHEIATSQIIKGKE